MPTDPEEFLRQDPRQLVDPRQLPDPLQLTPAENQEINQISHGTLKVAAGLAAAYLVYRKVMSRRVKEEVKRVGPDIQAGPLLYIASGLWNAMVPKWVSMTAPYLLAGYVEGVRDAHSGKVPTEFLDQIARGYAEELGHHINDVSLESLVSGFQAQVNRKIPPFLAARRAADAYGVPKRGMNTLVNVWISEDTKKFTDRVLPNVKEERARVLIETQQKLRARQIGDNEEWTARTQAKQIVWMYGQDKGVIPSTAQRVWITAADERVCEVCGPMDGRTAQIGKKFDTANGLFWTPPTHVNCRCDVVLDLNMTEDMQAELTALLESETVSKARPGDPYDRDNRGRFAAAEARSYAPQRPAGIQRKKTGIQRRQQPKAKPVDPFTAAKKEDPFAGRKIDPFAGKKPVVDFGPGVDPFAGREVSTPTLPGKEVAMPSEERLAGRDPFSHTDPFSRDDPFQKERNLRLEESLDYLFQKMPRPTLIVGGRAGHNWMPTPMPLITLLEPRPADSDPDNPWDDEYEQERWYEYDEIDVPIGGVSDIKVKDVNEFFEWNPMLGAPDKSQNPVIRKLDAYWARMISREMSMYSDEGEQNWARVTGSDGKEFVLSPDNYMQVLNALIYDYDVEDTIPVWLTERGTEYDEHPNQRAWEARDLADLIHTGGWNPYDWVETHTPTLFVTDYVSISDGVHEEGRGNYGGWTKGRWKNPGLYKMQDLSEDWNKAREERYKGSREYGGNRRDYFSHLPVNIAYGTPEGEEYVDPSDLDAEMHRGESWDD